MIVRQSAFFARAFKKLHKNQRNAVRLEVQKLVDNPNLGTQKKQDLSDVFVHKFKINNQLFPILNIWQIQLKYLKILVITYYRLKLKKILCGSDVRNTVLWLMAETSIQW